MVTRRPAEAFPPGEFLREELEERGWTQDDLASILGKGTRTVNEIVMGKRGITPDTARGLSAALGTTAEFWLNLESAYQLWRLQNDNSDAVAHRARLYTIAPVKDMIRRGWIGASGSLDVLERGILSFFDLPNLQETPSFGAHASRKSTSYEEVTAAQCAWLFRAMHLSQYASAGQFNASDLESGLGELRSLLWAPNEARHIPQVLGELGIRFVVVEHLPGTKIDGASFWLNDNPVIAVSIRFDRIDNFWFTLMHEIGHLADQRGAMDTEMESVRYDSERPADELMADAFATGHLVPSEALESFIARVSPLYTTERIEGFAKRWQIHPGIVVGQLQHRNELVWANFRRLLVNIRSHVVQNAITDGWGAPFPV